MSDATVYCLISSRALVWDGLAATKILVLNGLTNERTDQESTSCQCGRGRRCFKEEL